MDTLALVLLVNAVITLRLIISFLKLRNEQIKKSKIILTNMPTET